MQAWPIAASKDGWKLLAIVPATQDNGNSANALYVLGKSTDGDDEGNLPTDPLFDN